MVAASGGVPFAAERERFLREGIPAVIFDLCVAQAHTLRARAFAAAFAKLLNFFSVGRLRRNQERSVCSTKNGQSSTTHNSALARTMLSGFTGP
ncbi:MAG TPA: hypothetical protein VMH36_06305 [Alphaproteobacteria bacterium]|nr:hypothetical protein [Alphaproteobacteria bacterium]